MHNIHQLIHNLINPCKCRNSFNIKEISSFLLIILSSIILDLLMVMKDNTNKNY